MVEKSIVKSEKRAAPALTIQEVRRYICPEASDQEIGLFLRICQEMKLNPFAHDVYLIKYGEEVAQTIVAIDAYLKSAEDCPEYDGHQAGIILKPIETRGDPIFREGSFLLPEEVDRLAGGWAKVFRKDRKMPFYTAVSKAECIKLTKRGEVTKFWREQPATLLRKVALARALKEALPNRYAGILPDTDYEMAEDQVPQAYIKKGQPDWPKFWAVQRERGLSDEAVHGILHVNSLKDWFDQGKTLEQADEILRDFRGQEAKHLPEPVKETKPSPVVPGVGTTTEIRTTPPAQPQSKRDPATIKTLNDLLHACYEDFGMQPPDVFKELGVTSKADISQIPAECYTAIAAVKAGPPREEQPK